jgi:hypothetical protein
MLMRFTLKWAISIKTEVQGQKMHGASLPRAERKQYGRSRVTNGTKLFVSATDERSPWARRYRDLVGLFAEDAGGAASLSELKMGLIRRAAALQIECERMEGILAEGGKVDIDLLARTSSHLRRIAETIGLDRAVKDVTPDLRDILAAHSAAPAKPANAPERSADITLEAKPVTPSHASPEPNVGAVE